MGNNILKEKDKEELEKLVQLAKEQGNCINLNLVYMTMNINNMNYDTVMKYFNDRGVEMIQEDVEPDITAYSCEGEKIRPFDPSKINITMKPLTLDAMLKRIENEEIQFDTSFQRKAGLWNKRQKSQLIESIFLRIPLPAFYFDASDEEQWLIIDGLQRVSTLKEFVVDKKLKLQELEFFPELNGCNYDKLPRTFQRRIDETVINVYLVNPSTPENVKFNIFKRINTGGLALEPQEIRNALYQGQATTFLRECSQMECFVKATSGSVKSDRMLDREFVLRYISFCYLELDKYSGNIDEFLNEGMKYLNRVEPHYLYRIKKEFQLVMERMYLLMGKNAFRKICSDGRRRPINKVIYESWCYAVRTLSDFEADVLVYNKDILQERYMNLCETPEYLYLLKVADKKAVYERIRIVHNILSELLKEKIK
ncbi:MAG: DUF262 domain-containing protein [Lachnospiraceae bacterium]|nr:DUF262 domain-containing protein [Lachnospiraceae bacterium]